MRTLLSILVVSVLVGSCGSAPVVPEVPFRGPSTIGDFLEAFRGAPGGPPSISVAVSSGGRIVLADAVGWADEAAQQPATEETLYRTYSISKAITAVAVMQLVESGLVELDDPIQAYLQAFPDKEWPITLRQLLSHTSGIRHYKPNAGEISSTVEYPTLTESLRVFAADPLEFEPGSQYGYTSFGFNLLTGVVEDASGLSFRDYLQERVFDPSGAAASGLDVAGMDRKARATPYWGPSARFSGNYPIDEVPNVSGRYGSSGIVSTPSDLVRILIAIEEGKLLAPATVDLMWTPAVPDLEPAQALGWNTEGEGCRRAVYRSGAGTGYTGLLIHYPELRVGGAVLVNQNQWKGRVELLEGLLEFYVEEAAAELCAGASKRN